MFSLSALSVGPAENAEGVPMLLSLLWIPNSEETDDTPPQGCNPPTMEPHVPGHAVGPNMPLLHFEIRITGAVHGVRLPADAGPMFGYAPSFRMLFKLNPVFAAGRRFKHRVMSHLRAVTSQFPTNIELLNETLFLSLTESRQEHAALHINESIRLPSTAVTAGMIHNIHKISITGHL